MIPFNKDSQKGTRILTTTKYRAPLKEGSRRLLGAIPRLKVHRFEQKRRAMGSPDVLRRRGFYRHHIVCVLKGY